MSEPIWTGIYDVNSLVLNARKRLGLYGLLRILQDAAWLHADELGCGYNAMAQQGIFWVLTRQRVHMTRWPNWGEKLTVRSWARPLNGPRAPRDFSLYVDGEPVGEATTLWLTLDARTRKPQRNFPAIACRTDGALTINAEKIQPDDNMTDIATRRVRNADIDMNGHVNNTSYGGWILDTLPYEVIATHTVTDYEINFLAETQRAETVTLSRGQEVDGASLYQGRREDGKTAFLARLTLQAGDN